MQLFNVNHPTTLPEIQNYLASYASPEAAESDLQFNSPQGGDYLNKQYQALTGDPMASPIEDAKRARDAAVLQAAGNGASFAVGSPMGPSMLSAPATAPTLSGPPMTGNTGGVPVAPPPLNSQGQLVSPTAQRSNANAAITSMMQGQGNQFQMAGKDLQLPDAKANNYLSILDKRTAAAGVGDLFGKIYRSNPELFAQGSAADDPRFARVQGGKEGKIEAADALHPVALDPTFMQEARRNPQKAQALYKAVTNGRDYNTDIAAKSQLLAEQRDSRQKLIGGIKNVEADPVTGDLYKMVETKDLAGNLTQQRVPLTPFEHAAIETEGGFKRIYGVDLPDRAGLNLPGMTPQETADYRARTQQVMKEKGLDAKAASDLVHRQMYAEQSAKGKAPPSSATTSDGTGGMLDTMGFTQPEDYIAPSVNPIIKAANLLKGGLNITPRATNAISAMMGSKYRASLIPDLPEVSSSMNQDEAMKRRSTMDLLQQLLAKGSAGYSAP